MPRRLLPLALLLALFAVAAGCGGDDDSDDPAPESTSTTSADEDVASPRPESLQALVGPLPGLDPVAAQQWYLERESERQEAMVACMEEAGVEYVPSDPAQQAEPPWDADVAWDSDEWVETYGFGVSTLRYPSSVVGPELVGYPDVESDGEPRPNERYVERLSEEDQQAWAAAQTDCDARTWRDSQSANLTAAFNQRFSTEITELYDALRDDPRYDGVLDEIRTCVAAAGVEYDDHQSTLTSLEERLVPLDDAILGGRLDESVRTELAAIQQEEIATATAVADCDGRFLSENPDYRALVAEYEAEFIAEHEDELRDFLAAD